MSGRYDSIDEFYAARGGARSGESDCGVMWHRGHTTYPNFRVSVVHDTGDLYAFNQTTHAVKVLATLEHSGGCDPRTMRYPHDSDLCAYAIAENWLDGWADHISDPDSLGWIRDRLLARAA